MKRWTTGLVLALAAVTLAGAASRMEGALPRKEGRPLEDLPGLDGLYGVLTAGDGTRLRTILTSPEGATGRLPAILYVQWLACSTVELPDRGGGGWDRMLRRVATESGMVMWRTEKAGVGDSEGGPCSELDYETDLGHHRDALAALKRSPHVDPDRIVVFGASMGATMAPLVAAGQDVAGIVVWGGGAKTWFERTMNFERKWREGSGMPAARITAEMKMLTSFLQEYLVRGRTPEEIASSRPELGGAWELIRGAEGSTHYGRPLAFHHQAQARDFAGAWEKIDVPVLALYGEYDWFEDAAGHRLIARIVNGNHPGRARYVEIPRTDHHFARYATRWDAVTGEGRVVAEGPAVQEIIAFVREVAGD